MIGDIAISKDIFIPYNHIISTK